MNVMEDENNIPIQNEQNNVYTPKTPIWKLKMFLIITGICIVAVIAVITTVVLIAGNSKSDIEKRLETANRYLLELDYEQAKAEFEKIIKADPKCVEAYIGLAEAYEGLGEPDKAREVLEEGYEKTKSDKIKKILDETEEETSQETTTEEEITTEDKGLSEDELPWLTLPELVCDDIVPVKEKLTENQIESEPLAVDEGFEDIEEKVLYYIDGNAGLYGYDGKKYIDNSEALTVDFYGCVIGKSGVGRDLGGGSAYTLFWNEYNQTAYSGEYGMSIRDDFSSDEIKKMKAMNYPYLNYDGMGDFEGEIYDYYRLVGKNGKLVIDEKYEDIRADVRYGVSGDIAVVKKDGLWGYVKEDGTILSDYVYEDAYQFFEGIAAVKKDGKAGYIDKNGEEVIDFIFEETRSVDNGKAWVKFNGKWGVIDISKLLGEECDSSTEVSTGTESERIKEKILRAAKDTYNNYFGVTEVLFYDFNMDEIPEMCLLYPGYSGFLYGDICSYENEKYCKLMEIDGLVELTTYRNAQGKCLSVNEYYYAHGSSAEGGLRLLDPYITNKGVDIGSYEIIYEEGEELKEITTYYDSNNTEITKEQYDKLLSDALVGYTKVKTLNWSAEYIINNIDESFETAYDLFMANN